MNKNGIAPRSTSAAEGPGTGGAAGVLRGGSPGFKPQIPEEFRELMKKKQEERLRGVVVGKQE